MTPLSSCSNGVLITWNNGAERIKGYRAAEIIGRHFSRFYPQAVGKGFLGMCEYEPRALEHASTATQRSDRRVLWDEA